MSIALEKRRLQTHIWSLVVCTAVLIVVLVYLLWASYRQSVEDASITTQNLTQTLTIHVQSDLERVVGMLTGIAKDVEKDSFKKESTKSKKSAASNFLANRLDNFPAVTQVNVLDAKGTLLYSSNLGTKTFTIADRPYFKHLKETASEPFTFSDVQIARSSGHWALVVDRAIRNRSGKFMGVVAAVIHLDDYADLLRNINLGSGGVAFIRRADTSKLILRYPPGKVSDFNQALPKTNPIRQRIDSGERSGTLAYTATTDGIDRLASFRRLNHYPFYVQVSLSKEQYLSNWRLQVFIASSVLGIFLLIVVVSITRARNYSVVRLELEKAIVNSEARFHALFEASSDAVVVMSSRGLMDANQAALTMLGLSNTQELSQRRLEDFYPSIQMCGTRSDVLRDEYLSIATRAGSHRFECILKRADNAFEFPVEVSLSSFEFDGQLLLLATIRDVTERKRYEEQIHQLAFYDALTQLPNRRLLYDRLAQTLAQSQRSGRHGAVIYLDLDNFKPLNDLHGHMAGDLLLQEVATRLTSLVRVQDTVARLGGDEFVIVLVNLSQQFEIAKSNAEQVAEKIRHAFTQPFLLSIGQGNRLATEIEHRCTASIGVFLFTPHDTDAGDVLKRADDAMYQAKTDGRNSIRFSRLQLS